MFQMWGHWILSSTDFSWSFLIQMDTVKFCQDQFDFEFPSVLIVKRRDKFLARYKQFELDHIIALTSALSLLWYVHCIYGIVSQFSFWFTLYHWICFVSLTVSTTLGEHRRIGAQSTLGGKTFLPEKYAWKINKMPEFYMIFARKIFSRIFFWVEGRGKWPSASPSPTPMLVNDFQ